MALRDLLVDLNEAEEKLEKETLDALSDEEKALVLLLFMKSKEKNFSITFREDVKEGLQGYQTIKRSFLKDLRNLNPEINAVRKELGFENADPKVNTSLKCLLL